MWTWDESSELDHGANEEGGLVCVCGMWMHCRKEARWILLLLSSWCQIPQHAFRDLLKPLSGQGRDVLATQVGPTQYQAGDLNVMANGCMWYSTSSVVLWNGIWKCQQYCVSSNNKKKGQKLGIKFFGNRFFWTRQRWEVFASSYGYVAILV